MLPHQQQTARGDCSELLDDSLCHKPSTKQTTVTEKKTTTTTITTTTTTTTTTTITTFDFCLTGQVIPGPQKS